MGDKDQEDGRRTGERRVSQQPLSGEDRRKGERRSGKDRRVNPRSTQDE